MKKILVLISTLGVLAVVNARAVSVNFDDKGFASFDDVTTQYSGVGVTFQGFLASGAPVNLEAANNGLTGDNTPPSLPTSLSNFYNDNFDNRAYIMRMLFSGPTSGIGFQYNGEGALGANTVFNVYTLGGALLNSFTVAAANDLNYHPVSVADSGVGFIDIVQPDPVWGHYIDNLTFTPGSSVPDVASTGWLLSFGLASLFGIRRRLA